MYVTEYPGRTYITHSLEIYYTHSELRIKWKWFLNWIYKVHPQLTIINSDSKGYFAENISIFIDSTEDEIKNEKPKTENDNNPDNTGIIKGRI